MKRSAEHVRKTEKRIRSAVAAAKAAGAVKKRFRERHGAENGSGDKTVKLRSVFSAFELCIFIFFAHIFVAEHGTQPIFSPAEYRPDTVSAVWNCPAAGLSFSSEGGEPYEGEAIKNGETVPVSVIFGENLSYMRVNGDVDGDGEEDEEDIGYYFSTSCYDKKIYITDSNNTLGRGGSQREKLEFVMAEVEIPDWERSPAVVRGTWECRELALKLDFGSEKDGGRSGTGEILLDGEKKNVTVEFSYKGRIDITIDDRRYGKYIYYCDFEDGCFTAESMDSENRLEGYETLTFLKKES